MSDAAVSGLCDTCGAARVVVLAEDSEGKRASLVCSADRSHGPDHVPDDPAPRATKVVMPHRTPDGACRGAGMVVDADIDECPMCNAHDVQFAPGRPPADPVAIAAVLGHAGAPAPPLGRFSMEPFRSPCCGHLLLVDGLEADSVMVGGSRRLVVRRVLDQTDLDDPELHAFGIELRRAEGDAINRGTGRYELYRANARLERQLAAAEGRLRQWARHPLASWLGHRRFAKAETRCLCRSYFRRTGTHAQGCPLH